jgi:two-component system, chemotaxis family, protein-glutamate methylesterase/glutaminase
VLVVDDSVVVRTILKRAITSSPDFVVIDTAPNGQVGLEKVREHAPDVVTLDVEMPVMDGLTTLRALKREFPRLPVIMVSTLTAQGAEVTVDALLAGADSYIQKPTSTTGADAAVAQVTEELLPKLRSVVRRRLPAQAGAVRSPKSATKSSGGRPPAILAIGSSTGGPVALLDVLRQLPASFPIPIVITQHMPPMFTKMLASRLSAETAFRVREGERGAPLVAGEAWIAPGDFHMTVEQGVDNRIFLALNQAPHEHSCRPSVDVMFRSIARVYRDAALGVVLTGMGSDGAEGSALIRAEGGSILAQDEASSVVWGMPGAVAKCGAASDIVPLAEMGRSIEEYARFSTASAGRNSRGAHVA